MGPQRPGRGVREVLEELGLSPNQANSLRTQLLAYNDTHDKELSRSLGDNYDNLPLKVSRNFLNSQGEQFFGTDRAKWLWPQDSAALVERIAEIMRRQHAYKHDPTRKRRRSRSSDSTSSRSRKSSRRSSLRNDGGSDSLLPPSSTDTGDTRRTSTLPPKNSHHQLRSEEHHDDTVVLRPRHGRASHRSSHLPSALPMRPTTQQISQQSRQSISYQFAPDLSEATVVGHPRP